jgi:hypothetical protein
LIPVAIPRRISWGYCKAHLSILRTNKKLYGQNLLPVAAGRSQIDVTGKAKFAQYRSRLINDFFGSSMTTGQTLIAYNEADSLALYRWTTRPITRTSLKRK